MIKNLIILILILGFAAIIVFLDMPKVQDILGLREDIKTQKDKFSEKQIVLGKVEKLTKTYEENQEDLERVSYILPSGQDIPDLIVQLEALAFESGSIIESVEFSSEKKTTKAEQIRAGEQGVVKDYRGLNISLNLASTYSGFKNFLRLVEENIRLMDVNSIDFSTQSSEGSQLINFNLSITTYYQ